MDFNDTHELNSWLSSKSAKLQKAQNLLDSGTEVEKAVLEMEGVVRDYVKIANDGAIFEKVFGFDETVFDAQELLASAYVTQGRYDDALFLHRYVSETVQSIMRGRHRNREELNDIRDRDIYHLAKTATFLVHFSRAMSAEGNLEAASQLLNEAMGLSDTWYLDVKYPELRRIIDEQFDVLEG